MAWRVVWALRDPPDLRSNSEDMRCFHVLGPYIQAQGRFSVRKLIILQARHLSVGHMTLKLPVATEYPSHSKGVCSNAYPGVTEQYISVPEAAVQIQTRDSTKIAGCLPLVWDGLLCLDGVIDGLELLRGSAGIHESSQVTQVQQT